MTAAVKKKPNGAAHSAASLRLLELFAETESPEPIEVPGTDMVITPPTRTRRKSMHDAEMRRYVCTSLLSRAMTRVAAPKPVLPDDADEAATAAYVEAMVEWETAGKTAQDELAALGEQNTIAETDYERAFFGDVYDELITYFEDKPRLWDKLVELAKTEFLPPVPDDGICPTCGHVDEERAGKAESSST